MLIDVNAFCGRWPFTTHAPTQPQAVADMLAGVGVTEAHVSAVEAVLSPDPAAEENALAKSLAGQKILVHAPIIHPLRHGWRDALKRAANGGARMVKLVPTYHGYAADAPEAIVFVEVAGEANLTVALLMRMEDERRHYPLMKVPPVPSGAVRHLADRVAPRKLMLLNAVFGEVVALAAAAPTCHFDLAFCESADPVAEAVQAAGASRIHFGTGAPLLYARAQQMKLDHSTLDHATRAAVMHGNSQALFEG